MSKKLILQLGAIALFSVILIALWFNQQPPAPPKPDPVVNQPEPTPQPAPVVKKTEPKPTPVAKTSPVLSPLRFTPQAGQTLAYQFSSTGQTQFDPRYLIMAVQPTISQQLGQNLDTHTPEQTRINLSNRGELYLKYYPYQAGAWRVAARIELTEYLLNGAIPAYADPIQYPFAFTMDALGRIADTQFVAGIPSETEGAIETLLRSMQTQLALQRQHQWQTEEKDGMGTYQAQYRWLNPTDNPNLINLQKTKTAYTSTLVGQKGMMGTDINIQQSQSDISLQPDNAWILSISHQEHIDSIANGYVWSSYTYQFQAQRINRTAQPPFPNDFNTFLASLNDPAYRLGSYYATSEGLDAISRNLDLNGALVKYLELKNSDNRDTKALAEKFLVNYLRLFPQAAFELVELLNGDTRRERFDEKTQLTLWRLITEAGHTEAQQALAQAATNPDNAEITRIRAVIYSPDFSNPQPLLSDSLWGLYDSLQTSVERSDIELQNMTIYAIGGIAYQDRLNYQRPSEVGKQLVEKLKQSDDIHQTIELLQSLGNYGGSEILPNVDPYFNHANINVRAAAYDSLRRMDDPQAIETFIRHYQQEPSPQVRRSALFYLSKMQPNDNAMTWAREELIRLNEPKSQALMVEILGKHVKKYPDNERTLRAFAKTNPTNNIKREIYQYIQPEPPQTNNGQLIK